MPPTRVGHKKSRFGCIRCKQRHVKCDEQRPCGNCARHQVPCSLVLATLSPDDAAQPPAPTPTDAARSSNCSPFHASRSASDASQSPSTLPLPQRPSHVPSPQHLGPLSATSSPQALSIRAKVSTIREALLELTDDVERLERSHSQTPSSQRHAAVGNGPPHAEGSMSTNEWLGDLSLLYHYLATDGLCLSNENRQGELWQNIVPELAFTRDSLMHGLLALSALHLAYMHPEKKRQYATQSARHQEIALSRLRNGLFDINEENCHEYFILTFMILVLTFCSISNPFDDMHRIDTHQLGQSLFLGQGIMNLIAVPTTWEWIKRGPLACILRNPRPASPPPPCGAFAARLQRVSELVTQLTGSPSASKARSSCLVAADALTRVYSVLLVAPTDVSSVWMWPASLPADFRDHVGQRHPVALVILAHYAALVGCFRDRWYLDRWSEHVFEALDEALDEGWREWLEYPRSFGPKDLEEAVRELNERPRDDDGDAAPKHDCPLGR